MKVRRINVRVLPKENANRPYLYNEMLDLMNNNKFGGSFSNNEIILNSMPAKLLKFLKNQKIKYEIVSPKENVIGQILNNISNKFGLILSKVKGFFESLAPNV